MSEKAWRVRWKLQGRPKLCPKCNSRLEELGSLSGWLVPSMFFCGKCGYTGPLYVEHQES